MDPKNFKIKYTPFTFPKKCPIGEHVVEYEGFKCGHYCTFCEKRVEKIPEGFEICKECEGSGCSKCFYVGVISWTQKVLLK